MLFRSLAELGRLFKAGRIGKTYWAVVEGGPEQEEGRIDLPLGRKDATRGWWMRHAFAELGHEFLLAGARVSNPASRRVLEKCGFKWTGVALARIRALGISVPIDRYRLDAVPR